MALQQYTAIAMLMQPLKKFHSNIRATMIALACGVYTGVKKYRVPKIEGPSAHS